MFADIERLLGARIPKKTAGWSFAVDLAGKNLDNWFSLSR